MGYTSPVVSIFQLIKLKKNTTSATLKKLKKNKDCMYSTASKIIALTLCIISESRSKEFKDAQA